MLRAEKMLSYADVYVENFAESSSLAMQFCL